MGGGAGAREGEGMKDGTGWESKTEEETCREERFPSTATWFASVTIPIDGDPGVSGSRPVRIWYQLTVRSQLQPLPQLHFSQVWTANVSIPTRIRWRSPSSRVCRRSLFSRPW